MKYISKKLKDSRVFKGVYEIARPYLPKRGKEGFHGDAIYQKLIRKILDIPATSFIETGTYQGDSTTFVAYHNRNIPIFTSEVNESIHKKAQPLLRRFKNINSFLLSSEKMITALIKNGQIGNLPLFYLDAHWYDFWPLEDEIEIISDAKIKCIIVIDDFQVPDRPDFLCDFYEETGKTDKKTCNMELIRPKMNKSNCYKIIFPNYKQVDLTKEGGKAHKLPGHTAIFQNCADLFSTFIKEKVIKDYYAELNY